MYQQKSEFAYARDDSKQTDAKLDGNLTRNSSFSYVETARHMKQNLTVSSFFSLPISKNDIILEYMPLMSILFPFSYIYYNAIIIPRFFMRNRRSRFFALAFVFALACNDNDKYFDFFQARMGRVSVF